MVLNFSSSALVISISSSSKRLRGFLFCRNLSSVVQTKIQHRSFK
jgi:hypothetical protein